MSEEIVEDNRKRSRNLSRFQAWYEPYLTRERGLSYLVFGLLGLATLVLAVHVTSEYLVNYDSTDALLTIYRRGLQVGALLSMVVLAFYLAQDLSRSFFVKLAVSYLIYWSVAYGLLATQQINNEAFQFWDDLGSNAFEWSSWLMLLSILSMAGAVAWSAQKVSLVHRANDWLAAYRRPNLGLALLFAALVTHDQRLLDNLLQFLYLEQPAEFWPFIIALGYKVGLIVGTVSVSTFLFWRAVDGLKQNKSTLSLALLTSVLLALIFNYSIQYGIKADVDYLGYFIFPGATLFQIILLSLIHLSVYVVTNRYWLSTLLILFSGTAFTIANNTKFAMRSEPILLTDLSMLSQLDLIFSFVDQKLAGLAIGLLLGTVILYLVLKRTVLKGTIFQELWKRLALALAIMTSFSGIYAFFARTEAPVNVPVLSRLNNKMNIDFEGHASRARYQSLGFVWFKQLAKPLMEMPEGYNQAKIDEIVEKYQKRAAAINASRTQAITDETVIFILSESFSDPTRVEGISLSEPILPHFSAIQKETTSGLMRADNYGGGTANMETQSLVGLPLANLSAYIYNVEVVPKLAVLPAISDSYQAEDKYVIHLGGTQIYSRADVYNRLQFDTFIANDANATPPTMNVKYGGFPSDASTYQNILDHLDASRSQFFSVITYQNHVPWSMPEPASITGTGSGFTDKENERLSHYARLLKKTDEETKLFLDKLAAMDKKITVVFYGDHLPGFYPESAFRTSPENKYLTDYFIWSNHKKVKKDYPRVNSSDFPAALLSHTGSKVSPFYALLTDVLENQPTAKDDLKLVQYDLVSRRSYLEDQQDFFAFPD